MKTKRLLFISCLAAGALIASPSFGKPAKKSAGMSQFKAKSVAPHTTQVMRNDHHNQNINRMGGMGSTRYNGGTRYSGTRSYATRQYSGTRYYGGSRYASYYGNTGYYGGDAGYYYGNGWGLPEALPSGRTSPPQWRRTSASSLWAPGYNRYPYWSYGGYPYSGYNNYYSY